MPSIKKGILASAIIAVLGSGVSGCATSTALPTNKGERVEGELHNSRPLTLGEILSLESTSDVDMDMLDTAPEENKSLISDLRIKSVKEAAYSLGAQAGMAWRMTQINNMLEENATRLDRIYDFSRFLIDGKILSPVVMESKRMYHQESSKRARTVSVSYILSKDARIVPSAPSWREYLSRDVPAPQLPNQRLFPTNSAEVKVWKRNVMQGWTDGVEQANDIFTLDQRRLHRDYTGMQKFRMLVEQNLVSMPELAVGEFGVVKDGKTLNVNDVIYEISMDSDFTDKDEWKPIFRP